MPQKISLPAGTKVPDHIAIVLDGNRRWARSRGFSPSEGHRAGFKAVQSITKAARHWGVHTLTAWALSTENWQERPKGEYQVIMALARQALALIEKDAKKDGIRFVHLGRKDRLPGDIIKKITELEEKTRDYKSHVFNLALDYGGYDEIVRAVKKIVSEGVPSDKIDEKLFESYLDTADQPYPYPDLFIRTSGEQRTSGFLPWQMAYSEYYFESDHLPDFTPEKLRDAIFDYSRRRRRFGGNDADAMKHFTFDPEIVARLELSWWRLSKIPAGTRLRDYAMDHLRKQFGLSKNLALQASKLLLGAIVNENGKQWDEAKRKLKKFYKLIKGELKLAFEPEVAASLEIQMRKTKGESEEIARQHLAEVYRISLFQAAKAAHLRVLAAIERNLAERGLGDQHWAKAEDYLQKFYRALKERVA